MTIMTIEQFDSTCRLLELLTKLKLTSAEKTEEEFIETEGEDWIVCDTCGDLRSECRGPCDDGPDYSWDYDEDAARERAELRAERTFADRDSDNEDSY
jgi:hypothetical protein